MHAGGEFGARTGKTELERSVLATLAFFDLFDYPLTLTELHRYLHADTQGQATAVSVAAAAEVFVAVRNSAGIGQREGYYFLEGRDEIVATRQRRYRLAERKYRQAVRAAKLFSRITSIRMIAVCNSLAISNADEASDIDLFIVTSPGCIWVTRLLVVGLLKLFGLRPGERQGDVFCASFFVTEDAMNMSRFALSQGDTYLAYWTASLVPLYDAGGVQEKFLTANGWLASRLPGARSSVTNGRRFMSSGRGLPLVLPLLRFCEAQSKRLQKICFPDEIAFMANKDTRVVVTDDVLKFHTNDRRAQFESAFRKKIKEFADEREPALAASK